MTHAEIHKPDQVRTIRYQRPHLRPENDVQKDAQKVIQLVAERCSLDLDVLLGNIRTQRVAQVRWVAMHLLNQLLHMSLPAIGKALNRHHTSVMVGLRRVDAQIVADAVYAERLAEVVKEISNEVLGGVR